MTKQMVYSTTHRHINVIDSTFTNRT